MSYSIVGFPDMQIPFHDPAAVRAACDFAKERYWDAAVLFGDNVDLDMLSRYVEGLPGKTEGRRIKDDFALARDIIHSMVGHSVRFKNPNCKIFVLEGNHEKRIKKAYEKSPHMTGLFDIVDVLDLKELRATWVECDSVGELLRFEWRSGKIIPRIYKPDQRVTGDGVSFIHGKNHTVYHARKTIQEFNIGPIYYGHTHDVQRMPIKKYGIDSPRGGSSGCLCLLAMEYMEGRPNRWQHAVCEWTLDPKNPLSFKDPVHIIEEGKIVS